MSKSITVKIGDSSTLPLESIKKRTTRCVFLCYSTNLFIILCVFPFMLQSLGDVFAVRFNGGKRVVGCFLLGFENFRSVFFIAIYE